MESGGAGSKEGRVVDADLDRVVAIEVIKPQTAEAIVTAAVFLHEDIPILGHADIIEHFEGRRVGRGRKAARERALNVTAAAFSEHVDGAASEWVGDVVKDHGEQTAIAVGHECVGGNKARPVGALGVPRHIFGTKKVDDLIRVADLLKATNYTTTGGVTGFTEGVDDVAVVEEVKADGFTTTDG